MLVDIDKADDTLVAIMEQALETSAEARSTICQGALAAGIAEIHLIGVNASADYIEGALQHLIEYIKSGQCREAVLGRGK